jgi:hypothetical protein
MIIVVFQPYCDTTVLQFISYDETYLSLSDSENLQTDIKEEEDSLLIICPLTKTENEVSLFLKVHSATDVLLWVFLFRKFNDFVL